MLTAISNRSEELKDVYCEILEELEQCLIYTQNYTHGVSYFEGCQVDHDEDEFNSRGVIENLKNLYQMLPEVISFLEKEEESV